MGEIKVTVTVIDEETGVDHHGQGLLGIDRQIVGIDIARIQEDIVDRGLVDPAAQRQDRLQAGDRARAPGHREVDDEVVLERHARHAQ